ncbi:MAG: ATP-binding protein [Verrucomicrobiota bacterium]
MRLRNRLISRYLIVTGVGLLLLVALAYHEFVHVPQLLRDLGIEESSFKKFDARAEVILTAISPLVLVLGTLLILRSLSPIGQLAEGVERFNAENLTERLPRTQNGDEVDRLAASFNKMADRLENSFKQVREFTLHASHELKTPLTVMRAEMETALRDADGLKPDQREWIHSQIDELERLAKLVDGLTLLAKADAGQIRLDRNPVPLKELMTECYDDTLVLAQPAHITVELRDCQDAVVLGDRHRLRQMLLNLADNAVKHNSQGGHIVMALRKWEKMAEIEMTNTGPGIPAKLQGRIFERFVRGAQDVEGSGLGLAICQWIVREHGGNIQVESRADGKTSFTIIIPLAA